MGLRSKLRSVKLFLKDPSAWADERSYKMNQAFAENAIDSHREARDATTGDEGAKPKGDASG